MKSPDWSKRTAAALRGTTNVVALTIVACASFLTLDIWLAMAGLILETAFLIWATWSPRYEKRLEARRGMPRPKPMDVWLLIVTVSGFVVILFFGFGLDQTTRWALLSHAQRWETGAIGWTALFFHYYLFKSKGTGSRAITQVVFFLVALTTGPLLLLVWWSMEKPVEHVALVLLLRAYFLLFDLVTAFKHENDEEQKRSMASLVGADIPMVATLSFLLLYVAIYSDVDNLDVFVSGVIGGQLLISNAILVATEFGWLQPPSLGETVSNPHS